MIHSSRSKRSSDAEVESACDDIADILFAFDNPQDADVALLLVHYEFLIATYPPEERERAIRAAQSSSKLLIKFLNEGW